MCYYKKMHYGHKIIDINDVKIMAKENISIQDSTSNFD